MYNVHMYLVELFPCFHGAAGGWGSCNKPQNVQECVFIPCSLTKQINEEERNVNVVIGNFFKRRCSRNMVLVKGGGYSPPLSAYGSCFNCWYILDTSALFSSLVVLYVFSVGTSIESSRKDVFTFSFQSNLFFCFQSYHLFSVLHIVHLFHLLTLSV